MLWNDILCLHAWTPLSNIESDAEQVFDGVFKIGPNAYVKTQMHNMSFETGDPHAPFITKAYWAPHLDALKRSVIGDPLIGADKAVIPPPEELLLGTSGLYAELIEKIPLSLKGRAERAIYSNKGAFLYRLINIGRLNYCFLGNENRGNDLTFLIDISLLK